MALRAQVRVVLLYARSATLPVHTEYVRTPLPIDVIYMHEKPVAGVNCPQEVRCNYQAFPHFCCTVTQGT